jgi:hypothetical protein
MHKEPRLVSESVMSYIASKFRIVIGMTGHECHS